MFKMKHLILTLMILTSGETVAETTKTNTLHLPDGAIIDSECKNVN
jgi:hypothetical protein